MRKATANRIFKEGIEALEIVVEKTVCDLSNDQESLKTLTGYPWIQEQWNAISEWMTIRK